MKTHKQLIDRVARLKLTTADYMSTCSDSPAVLDFWIELVTAIDEEPQFEILNGNQTYIRPILYTNPEGNNDMIMIVLAYYPQAKIDNQYCLTMFKNIIDNEVNLFAVFYIAANKNMPLVNKLIDYTLGLIAEYVKAKELYYDFSLAETKGVIALARNARPTRAPKWHDTMADFFRNHDIDE